MKLRKRCPICSNSVSLLKTVDGIDILECKNCEIGISAKIKETNLYKKSGQYNLAAYKLTEAGQIKKFESIADFVNKLGVKSVLEIGAGYGLFSKILSRNKKLQIEIVEPNLLPIYISSDNKITKHRVDFDKFYSRNNKTFDLVILLDVFEHLDSPRQELRKFKNLLNKRGRLLILLPNYKSLMAKLCKNWSWWMVEDHRYHFSPRSITKMLGEENFEIKKLSSFESLHDFKKNLDGNFSEIKISTLRKFCKGLFYLLFFPAYLLLRKIGWRLGLGGLILVLAEKNDNDAFTI